jgi:hypothetical protein
MGSEAEVILDDILGFEAAIKAIDALECTNPDNMVFTDLLVDDEMDCDMPHAYFVFVPVED